ncbi:MAG: phosphate ABC transporter permease PstA [Pseudomonadota bacterium]
MATSDAFSAAQSGWWRSGDPWLWINATAVAASLLAVGGVLLLITWSGLAHFWPDRVYELTVRVGATTETVIGARADSESLSRKQYSEATGVPESQLPEPVERWLIKQGNRREAPRDFRWIARHTIDDVDTPANLWVLERTEWGNAYGRLISATYDGAREVAGGVRQSAFAQAQMRSATLRRAIAALEEGELSEINYELERLRLHERRLLLGSGPSGDQSSTRNDIDRRRTALRARYDLALVELTALRRALDRDSIELELASGAVVEIPLATIVRAWQPNAMSSAQKLVHFLRSLGSFLSSGPREANTEGGVFPAIFGTVMMVLLMALLVTPLGVLAAIYLSEYARQGAMVQLIRVAVNNLAGVPSIVYGVFGLGFFVYFLGGNIDRLFFPEALPAPTFGTPGILWASLTLALLTVPVVIVSTEEGLARIPRTLREGSLALGATKAETLFRIVLPIAAPSILTGVILAVARAAGEVAPLMLVGVVKLAPALPVDGNFPFVHLERKFMHLGFHIYDVGFQSPNVEAARPLVYATALLLVLIVLSLNLAAIWLRGRLEQRFRGMEH